MKTPRLIPKKPIILPWFKNIFKILMGFAPNVLNMAISDCFSLTTITRVDMILKTATATAINKITNNIDFVI